MTIESENAKEEVKEIVEKCIKCGVCKIDCPVFRIIREEQYSPRGRAIMLDKGYYEKIVYECSLCGACKEKCPLNLDLPSAIIKARKVLVEQKREPQEVRDILKNIQETGNIYGIKKEVE